MSTHLPSKAAQRPSFRFRILSGLTLAFAAGVSAIPPEGAHPGWTVVNLRPTSTFRPMVTGLGFLSDGSLAVAHWGGSHNNIHLRQRTGIVYILKGVTGNNPSPVVSTYAEGLEDAVGMLVKDDRIYVTGGERLIELPDADKNGKAEAARTIVTIPGTHARHEFLFGLVFKDGKFWMAPSSGKDVNTTLEPWGQLNPNRGTVMSVDPVAGTWAVHAMGFREPNGLGLGPDGELFAPDVQGNWLPANKLIHVKQGRFYGFKHDPPEIWDTMAESPPVVYLPQTEVARAPGNPLYVDSGKYAGQMLLGDAVAGGIRRIFVEKVAGEYQGAVFFFSGGLEAGANRLLWGPDGHLYVGMCGQGSGWSFKQDFGLQKLRPNGASVFEMLSVRARAGGMEIEYTDEINAAAEDKASYTVRSWHYNPTSAYGGPAVGTKTLPVASVEVSTDRRKVYLQVPGLEARKVVYISLGSGIASKTGGAAWTKETWYTMNALGTSRHFETTAAAPDAMAARRAGWDREIRAEVRQGRLIVRMGGQGGASVQVRNMQGTLAAEAAGPEALRSGIATAGWAPGVYTVQIREGGLTAHRRVVVP